MWKYIRIRTAHIGDTVHFHHGNGYCGVVMRSITLPHNNKRIYAEVITGYGHLSLLNGYDTNNAIGTIMTITEAAIYEVYSSVELY